MRPLEFNRTLPQGWRFASFSDVFRRAERKVTLDESASYNCVGVRWYGNGAFVRQNLLGMNIARKQQWIIRAGDVVYNKLFAWKGAFAIADDSVDGCIVSDKFPTYEVDAALVDPRLLAWYFRTPELAKQAEGLSKGAAAISKLTLNPPQFWDLTLPLPPLDEQRRIVARIEELAAKIEGARTLRRETATLSREAMESFIEDLMRRLPTEGVLGDVVSFRPRSGPSFVTSPDWTGTRVLMPSSVTGFGVDTSRVEYGLGGEKISPKDRLLPGDILIARGNKRDQVGNAGIVPLEAEGWVCANLLMRMRLDEHKADPDYCIYWFRAPTTRRYVATHMTGTNPNIQKINQKTILALPFPTETSLSEQRRIVAELNALQAKVDKLKRLQAETAAELDALLPSILDKAFKGAL